MDLNTDELLELSQKNPAPIEPTGSDAPPPADVPADPTIAADALKQFGLQSVDELVALRQRADRVNQLEFELLELQAKAQADPYKTPAARRIDEMLAAGHPVEDVMRYMKLASLDLNTLDGIEALRYEAQVKNPGWDTEMIEDWIVEKLGLEDISDLQKDRSEWNAKQRRKMEESKKESFSFLKDHLLPIDNSEAVKSAQERAAVATETINTWKAVVPKVKVETFAPVTSVSLEGEQMDFSYQPTSEALELARTGALDYIQQNPQHFPRNQEGLQAVQGLMQAYLIQAEWKNMLDVAIRDAYAKAKADAAKLYSGNGVPLARTGGQPQDIKTQKPLSQQEKIMRGGLV